MSTNFIAGTSIVDPASKPPVKAPAILPATSKPTGSPTNKLLPIIHSSVRDRWMTGQLSMYTPTMIENTIRGAMSGNLMSLWLMFDLMERTWPRLSKNLNELKTAVANLGWNLQPFALKGDKPTPEAQRRKRIIEQMIWTIRPNLAADENDFEDTLRDVMDAVGKGISLVQVDYEQRAVNVSTQAKTVQMQALWCPRATQWVHPRYYGYPSDGLGNGGDHMMLNVREILQNDPAANIAATNGIWGEIPRDQFIVSIFKQKSGHPLGGSLLSILGFWWAAQTFTWDWFLNFAQLFGMPIRWATYAPGIQQQTIDGIMDMLAQMGQLAYGAFPQGTNLDLKTAATDARNVPHKVLIDAADTICDVLILGQTSSTQIREGGGVGSGHAADLQGDVRKEKIMGCARRTAKIINVQMLPALCRVNFGDDSECPYLLPADKSGKDAKAVADRYQVILNTPGVKVSKQQYYEDNDLIVPDEDDETLSATPAAKPNTLPFGGNDNAGAADALDNAQGRGRAEMTHLARARGQDVPPDDSRLVDNALADATGIAPRWLGAVRPIFEELVAKAKDGSVNDADFISAVMKAQAKLPDVFGRMDHKALERVIEGTLGAAVVNGAVRGAMERHVRTATKSGGAR